MKKIHLRTGHEGPEREKNSSTLSLTSALDGVGVHSYIPATLRHGPSKCVGQRSEIKQHH